MKVSKEKIADFFVKFRFLLSGGIKEKNYDEQEEMIEKYCVPQRGQ